MLDLGDAPGVVAKVDEALGWFKAAGSRYPFQGRWAGVSLPAEIVELINELDRALTEVGPAEAGVSSERWLSAWQFTHRAADAIRGGDPGVGIEEAEGALRMVRRAFKRPRPDRVSPPDRQDLEVLLRKAKINRPPVGTGTLDTERVVFLSGEHNKRLELIDTTARRLGYAVPVNGLATSRATEWEFRTGDGHRFLTLTDTGQRRWFVKKRSYEIRGSDADTQLTVRQTNRRSSAVLDGAGAIGVVRRGGRHAAFVVEDHSGRAVARIAIARVRSNSRLVDVAVEIEDLASVPLRNVALAAGLIADHELVSTCESGPGA